MLAESQINPKYKLIRVYFSLGRFPLELSLKQGSEAKSFVYNSREIAHHYIFSPNSRSASYFLFFPFWPSRMPTEQLQRKSLYVYLTASDLL